MNGRKEKAHHHRRRRQQTQAARDKAWAKPLEQMELKYLGRAKRERCAYEYNTHVWGIRKGWELAPAKK